MKVLEDYKQLLKNPFLAELIGVILGDGCITKYDRTQSLRITCHSEDKDYIKYIIDLTRQVFKKQPTYSKRKDVKAVDIRLYQKYISERLKLPAGNKIRNNIKVPRWIYTSNVYIKNCLKGLFDTDGHFRKSEDNYLHVIELKNHCQQILDDAFKMLKKLGYHPQKGKVYVRLARKHEVYDFVSLINFRNNGYPSISSTNYINIDG